MRVRFAAQLALTMPPVVAVSRSIPYTLKPHTHTHAVSAMRNALSALNDALKDTAHGLRANVWNAMRTHGVTFACLGARSHSHVVRPTSIRA